jgi:glycosyltransferase involved in cell wall biosynthesis
MLTAQKLAVLAPVYNGGELLAPTLMSCAHAGLAPDRYEILVVDNCSTDGAVDRIPFRDPQGAVIQIHTNHTNVGRVGNWNRAVGIAREQGFRYITFLFVGDSWIPGGSLPQLFDLVRESEASAGFSSFAIANEAGKTTRHSQRFYVSDGGRAVTSRHRFVETLTAGGLFPLGPLQANIYRLSPGHTLRFDANIPTRADVDATFRFIQSSDRPIAIVSRPFFRWRERRGRFHMSMGVRQTMRDYMDTFHFARSQAESDLDFRLAKSRLILNSLRLALKDAPASEWPTLAEDLLRYASSTPDRIAVTDLLNAMWWRFACGRRLLEFRSEDQPAPHGESCVAL